MTEGATLDELWERAGREFDADLQTALIAAEKPRLALILQRIWEEHPDASSVIALIASALGITSPTDRVAGWITQSEREAQTEAEAIAEQEAQAIREALDQ